MLEADWPWTRLGAWIVLVAFLAFLALRAVRRDRREYRRFTRYRTTRRRQEVFRRWLLESFVTFGGATVVVLLTAGAFVLPLRDAVDDWLVVRTVRRVLAENAAVSIGVSMLLVIGMIVLTVLGIVAARREGEVPTVGNIRAMLPRNRQELLLGAALSINAGVVEELAFRLALPALVYAATGSAELAVIGTVLLFGALHLYQGATGVVGTTVVGAILMTAYIGSGSILLPIVIHALFDLRTMVLIPMTVYGVQRIDGRVVRTVSLSPSRQR
jgi:membrane protease YdiL (CAAX protease family)